MEKIAHLPEDLVLFGIEAGDRNELIRIMVEAILENWTLPDDPPYTADYLIEQVCKREEEKSTWLGRGYAFPHARIAGFPGAVMCVAFLKQPVDFGGDEDEEEDKHANIVCLLLVPEDEPQIALKIMSQFSRVVSDPVDSDLLHSVTSPRTLSGFLSRHVLGVDAPITARDIMRQPFVYIRPDTHLKEVTRIMHQHMLDAIAVTDEEETLLGLVTCDHLFKLGMPDFFGQLKSVSFISEFDPFEKYFKGESEALAKDVMTQEFATVPEDATLLEVVFELAVNKHPKVYVVDEAGKRVGVIDRILVLDRVINF